jgi:DNA-binding Xre family transcriptional regulator
VTRKMGIRWHLRELMALQGMFATTDLVPLLAERGVVLSREQVYRLVTRTPERLNTTTLAALCDILGVGPGDLIEVVAESRQVRKSAAEAGSPARTVQGLTPRPARIITRDEPGR